MMKVSWDKDKQLWKATYNEHYKYFKYNVEAHNYLRKF